MRTLPIALLLMISLACEKSIELDLPLRPRQISVDARLYAGDSAIVFPAISGSIPAGENPVTSDLMEVILYEDGIAADTLVPRPFANYGTPIFRYHSGLVIQPGKSYTIECGYQDLATARATDIVPAPPRVKAFRHDSLKLRLEFVIEDYAESGDLYLVEIYNKKLGAGRSYNEIKTLDSDLELLYLSGDVLNGDIGGRKAVLNDENFNGRSKKVVLYYGNDVNFNETHILRLSKISQDFYRYEKSRSVQYLNDLQFFSEGTNLHSNVVNGFGSFVMANPIELEFTP